MPPLLQKFRAYRQRRQIRRAAHRAKTPAHHHHRWFWFAVAGSVVAVFAIFFWVTSARLLKEPIRLDYGPNDPAFASALGPVLGAEFVAHNSIQTLVNGDRFFPAMLAAIRGAQKTITFETYIWAPGHISDEFTAALTERARHGVRVHVLVDGMGTLKFTHRDREKLTSAGVQFLTYGREHWWELKPNINHRTHRKLLIVDGRIGFTGGMCVDDHWLGDAGSPGVWRDTEVRVEGPAVRQMQAVFATNWLQTTSNLLLGEDYFPTLAPAGPSVAECFMSGPGEGPQKARLAYLFAIASARRSIDISHAYFVPDDLAVQTLIAARQRGVRVRVIVPAINDSRIGRAASRSRWGPLLDAGVEFYQFEPAMYHCKTMIVDDEFVTVGSANFDNRSFSINDEVGVNVLDREVAADNERVFADDLRRSRPLTRAEFAARPFYIKLADHLCGLLRSQF